MVPRRLSRRHYGVVVSGGLSLTALQALLLPRALGLHGFGVVVIGISITQAVFALGDLGFTRLADDTTRLPTERSLWRGWAMNATAAIVVLCCVVCAGLAVLRHSASVPLVAGLSAVTAYVLTPLKLAAGAAEARGDEVSAARYHFLWQNVPKLGLVVGAVVGRDPTWAAVGGLACAGLVGRPRRGHVGRSIELRSVIRELTPAWLSALSSFLVVYGGTYSIGVVGGLAAAGRYDFDYRVFLATTYLYYPFASILTARINKGDRDAPRRVTLRAAAVVACAGAAAVGVLPLGQRRAVGFNALPVPTLAILAAVALFSMVAYLMAATLIAYGRLWPTVTASVASGIVVVIGQPAITPTFGPVGAASVSLAAVIVAASLQTRTVVRFYRSAS